MDVKLRELTRDTLYEPYATSLRMSDIGYRNRNQAGLVVSGNSFGGICARSGRAPSAPPHPAYEAMGVKGETVNIGS